MCLIKMLINYLHTGKFWSAVIHRGSYASAHVLLNLFNELRKIDQMRGPTSILSLFRNVFNKFNITGERIYHITLKSNIWRKKIKFYYSIRSANVSRKSVNH